MNTVKIQNYRHNAVKYVNRKTHFSHNIEYDYQIVLLQKDHAHDLKRHVEEFYSTVIEYELIWTRKHLAKNKQRLGIPAEILSDKPGQNEWRLKALIFEIETPEYRLTSAGTYEVHWDAAFANSIFSNVVLHSNNIESFFHYATLLIGPELLTDLISPGPAASHIVSRNDLVGAAGWDSFHQMLSVCNICSDWLVLRNADLLPDNFWGNDRDIDILCRDLGKFLSATNAIKRGTGLSDFYVYVESRKVPVDARFLGDDYYDRTWQEDMLLTKEFNGVVPSLNTENHFFSLLYHARIHKDVVKPVYILRLTEMANSLEIEFNDSILSDDRSCAVFMDSYFQNRGYRFTYPHDYACYQNINRNVTRHLINIKPARLNWAFSLRLAKHRVLKFLPQSFKAAVKRVFSQ